MWRELIIYSVKNKAYKGCDLPDLGIDNEDDLGNDPERDLELESKKSNAHDQVKVVHQPMEGSPQRDCSTEQIDASDSAVTAPSDLSQSALSEPTSNEKTPLHLPTKDIENLKLSENSTRPKKIPCAKFIAQSSSPSPSKTADNLKTQVNSIDNVQWSSVHEVPEKSNFDGCWKDTSDKNPQGMDTPKPQRKSRVRLVSKDRKRRDRSIFDRVLRKDVDTDSESNSCRDWFPTVDEWLISDQSDISTQDDSQSDQSMGMDQSSGSVANSPDRSDVKKPVWSTVEGMLDSLMKESHLYREKQSGDRKRSLKKAKGKNVERNLVLETIFGKCEDRLSEKLNGNGNDGERNKNRGKGTCVLSSVQSCDEPIEDLDPCKESGAKGLTNKWEDDMQLTSYDVKNNESETSSNTNEAFISLNGAQIVGSDEGLIGTHSPKKVENDFRENDDAEYKRMLKMCQTPPSPKDPPTKLETKIIRQIEVTLPHISIFNFCKYIT